MGTDIEKVIEKQLLKEAVKESVKEVVTDAVREMVKEAVREAVKESAKETEKKTTKKSQEIKIIPPFKTQEQMISFYKKVLPMIPDDLDDHDMDLIRALIKFLKEQGIW